MPSGKEVELLLRMYQIALSIQGEGNVQDYVCVHFSIKEKNIFVNNIRRPSRMDT